MNIDDLYIGIRFQVFAQFGDVYIHTPCVKIIVIDPDGLQGKIPLKYLVNVVTQEFQQFGSVLDGCLEGRDWLVGDAITLADYSVAANLTYASAVGIEIEPFANIRRWYDAIEGRDAWQRSAPPPMV